MPVAGTAPLLHTAPLQVTHDPRAKAAYIRFRARQGEVEALRVTSDFLVDIDATGAVCGIELLNANEQLVAGDDGRVTFANRLDGTRGELRVG